MQKAWKLIIIGALAVLLTAGIFFLASHIEQQDSLRMLVERFGVLGIFLVSLVANLNLLVPLHGAAFAPVFIAAGFSLPVIILVLAVGTTCADLLSYVLGYFGKTSIQRKYPEIHKKIDYFLENKQKWILPGIFFYSAFVPFPNELFMLPLGLMGYKLRNILIPLILGTMVNTTIFTFGFSSVFNLLFS